MGWAARTPGQWETFGIDHPPPANGCAAMQQESITGANAAKDALQADKGEPARGRV